MDDVCMYNYELYTVWTVPISISFRERVRVGYILYNLDPPYMYVPSTNYTKRQHNCIWSETIKMNTIYPVIIAAPLQIQCMCILPFTATALNH